MIPLKDRNILRELASAVAPIAAMPEQEETRRLWRCLNDLSPERPMVEIDQVCWHEMDVDGKLALHCTSVAGREYETYLRRTLYQWRHFPVDRVVEPFIRVPMAIESSGFGVEVSEQTVTTDAANDVVSHAYENQFATDDDLAKIRMPVISHDEKETARRLEEAHEIFGGILDLLPQGVDPYLSVWDPICTWMGAQEVLFALVDRPEFMLAMARRMVQGYLGWLDQLETKGLLVSQQSQIHCTGAYTDELPAAGFDPKRPRTRDLWMFGLAQLLGSVSPQMYESFEIETSWPLFSRFGRVYYGCCEPLHDKMPAVRKIPNLRKISVSPWAKEASMAEQIGADFVYSRKPNPAFLASVDCDEDQIRDHLKQTITLCRQEGCPLELIQKDISTVRHEPQRLWRWAQIAMELVCG